MIEKIYEIPVDRLLGQTQEMMYDDYRFVTATCVDNGDHTFDVIYHFDRDLELINYRIKVTKDQEVPSVSRIYFSAAIVENEMKELFGLNVTNIVIDYEGHLLLSDSAPENPMARQQITIVQKGEKENA